MDQKLKGKVAIITGSDSGIGQATAIRFAEEGADVLINYLHDKKGAEETRKEVESKGKRAVVVQADMSREEEVDKLFEQCLKAFGTVDILVNNAGLPVSGVPVIEMDTDVFDKAIKTDVYGYFFSCRRFARLKKEQGGKGKIINVTSVHEDLPMKGSAEYDAAKGAIRNLSRTLALELAEYKINVNNLAPGMVLTPMNQEALDDPEVYKKRTDRIPLKRAALPDEVGRVAVFLASDDSDYVTGSSYFIDGGMMLRGSER